MVRASIWKTAGKATDPKAFDLEASADPSAKPTNAEDMSPEPVRARQKFIRRKVQQ